MLTKKKKLSKKEIKQDRLVTFYYKAYGYFEENKTKILYYIVGLVAVIALSAFYIYHRNQQNNEAGLELSRVIPSFDSGSYLEAIEGKAGSQNVGFKKIVSDLVVQKMEKLQRFILLILIACLEITMKLSNIIKIIPEILICIKLLR